jgi:hypothetical protein
MMRGNAAEAEDLAQMVFGSVKARGIKRVRTQLFMMRRKLMNTQKKLMIFVTMLAFLIMLPAARASEIDQATKLTFNRAVQIPGRVLPAGTYWFKLLETGTSPGVVQIFNSDWSTVYATIPTVNAERQKPTDNTTIIFAARGSTQPETLVLWFYPGEDTGHEFVYSPSEEQELAQVKHHTVMAAVRDKRQTQPAAPRG